jgi:hypothetical protein
MHSRDQFFYSMSMLIIIIKTHKKFLQVQFNYNIVFNLKYFVHHSDVLIIFLLIISYMNFTLQMYLGVHFIYLDRKLH